MNASRMDGVGIASADHYAEAERSLVEADLEEGTFAERVQKDFTSGVRSGVNGTPTFFINGVRFDGNWTSPSEFLEALKEAATQGAHG